MLPDVEEEVIDIFIDIIGRLARDLRRRCGEGEGRSGPAASHPPLRGKARKIIALCNALLSSS
jgi:hypothetical protein